MRLAICQVSVSPLRSAAADSSEMVSQVLFGEKVEVLEELEKWSKVRLAFDGYEGWKNCQNRKEDKSSYFYYSNLN